MSERDVVADAELIGHAQDARGAVLVNALAVIYQVAPEEVAELCDSRLDTSGALLGQVRKRAAAAVPEAEETPP